MGDDRWDDGQRGMDASTIQTVHNTWMQRRLGISHTRIVLSADAENNRLPATSTAHTISSCPVMMLSTPSSERMGVPAVTGADVFVERDLMHTLCSAAHSCSCDGMVLEEDGRMG